MNDTSKNHPLIWRATPLIWLAVIGVVALIWVTYAATIRGIVNNWSAFEEYSYGYFIPVISLFLIWQQKDRLERIQFDGSWVGVLLVLSGVGLYLVGELGAVAQLTHYSFVVVVAGLAFSFLGWVGFRIIVVPIVILLFMIPIPTFLFHSLSSQLQLISSALGVAVIRLFNISVYLEGNVIDLGSYKLQVVEACSGLRYLFPLMVLGFIAAYFFKQAFWKRMVVFLSTIPITVAMNSFRIGVIGVLVEYWGQGMAEGFLHDFEGWVVFMACTALLIIEMAILARIGSDRRSLNAAFGIEFPDPTPADARKIQRKLPAQFLVSGTVVAILIGAMHFVGERAQVIPARDDFVSFPMVLSGWDGKGEKLEQIYIDALNLDDHVLINYSDKKDNVVTFYAAYYNDQNKSKAIHSPRTCLPGGGWLIDQFSQERIDGIAIGGVPLKVNRVVIKQGEYRQLVYYWFQQRGRIITNEYLVKWYIFLDALLKGRTDGALVRLSVLVPQGRDIAEEDALLKSLLEEVGGILPGYIPG